MTSPFDIQIHSFSDKTNNALHNAAALALGAGTAVCVGAGPSLALGAGLAYLLHYKLGSGLTNWMQEHYYAQKGADLPLDSQRLPEVTSWFCQRLKMDKVPPLYVFAQDEEDTAETYCNAPPSDTTLKDTLHKLLSKVFRTFANAAAYGTDKKGMLISIPLMKQLSPNEEASIIAHELGHIAAKHLEKAKTRGFLVTAAKITSSLHYLGTLLNWAGLPILAAKAVLPVAAGTYTVNYGREKEVKEIVKAIMPLTTIGILAAWGTPEIITAYAGMKLVGVAGSYLSGRASRCNEYQADRIAVSLVHSGDLFSTALDKIDAYNKRVKRQEDKKEFLKSEIKRLEKGLAPSKPIAQGSLFDKLHRCAKEVNGFWDSLDLTHPTVPQRKKNAQQIQRSLAKKWQQAPNMR